MTMLPVNLLRRSSSRSPLVKAMVAAKSPRRALAVVALAAALGISGCSTTSMDTAATVNGEVISESALQHAVDQIAPVVPTTPAAFLDVLLKGPVLAQKAQGQPFELSREETVAAIREQAKVDDPEPLLVDFVRYNFYLQNLGPLSPQELEGLRVEVNPRYGTWDPATGALAESVPDWISPVQPSTD